MKKIILASASPRRREILEKLGFEFSIMASQKEPPIATSQKAEDFAYNCAKTKAEDIFSKNPNSSVIGADTIVVCDGKILGKPKDKEDAFFMLKMLSARKHQVVTAVYVCTSVKSCGFTQTTDVEFYPLTDREIEDYIKSGDGEDKAGSYGIQSLGMRLVKGISGDYQNVVGFPAAEFLRFLERENINL